MPTKSSVVITTNPTTNTDESDAPNVAPNVISKSDTKSKSKCLFAIIETNAANTLDSAFTYQAGHTASRTKTQSSIKETICCKTDCICLNQLSSSKSLTIKYVSYVIIIASSRN
jgi:hypothetical protein